MPTLYDRLNILKRVKRDVRVEALVRTIPHASSRESDAIVAEIIEIASGSGREALLLPVFRVWPHISSAARSAVISASKERLSEVLAHLRDSEHPGDRSALSSLLIETGAGEGQANLLDMHDPSIFSAMDTSLAESAARLPGESPKGLIDRILDHATAPGPKLRAWLADTDQPGHMRLRASAKKMPESWLDARAVTLLGVPALSGVASGHIGSSESTSARAGWLGEWHLLLARDRQKALRRHMDDRHAFDVALTPADDASARVGGIVWLAFVCRNRKRVSASLASCLTDPSSRVRLTAARAVKRLPNSTETDDVLLDYAFDANPRVAEASANGLAEGRSFARDQHLVGAYRALTRSPHARVRRVASNALSRANPEDALRMGDRLSCPIAARRMLARDRAGFVTWLKEVCRGAETELRVRGLELADRLNVLEELEAEVVRAVRDADERVASKAALLVGKLKGPGPSAALRYTLGHASDRVRANGVESFACVAETDEQLVPFVRDDASRVRANAIRHFLRAGASSVTPENALVEMLADPRAGHRLSALWAAQSGAAISLAGRIDDMSKTDPDARVVSRARSCNAYFNRMFRAGWATKRAGEDAPEVKVRSLNTSRRHVG
jgi:HEAT repeat protein